MYSFVVIADEFGDYKHARGETPLIAFNNMVELLGRTPVADDEKLQCWRIPAESTYEIAYDGCPECTGGNGISTRMDWSPEWGEEYYDPSPTTPWGFTIKEVKLIPGIMADRSLSQGGLVLSVDRISEVKQLFPEFEVDPMYPDCFSEAADFAAVIFRFPEIATEHGIRDAIDAAIENGLRDGAESRWIAVVEWLKKSEYANKLIERSQGFDAHRASVWIVESSEERDDGFFSIGLRRGKVTRTTVCNGTPLQWYLDDGFPYGWHESVDMTFHPERYRLISAEAEDI